MRLLWSKNKTPFDQLIMWAFDEPCAHFAVEFDNKFILHSNMLGFHPVWSKNWHEHNTVVHSIEVDLPLEKEEQVFQALLDANNGKPYDFLAVSFFAWRALLWKCFRIPLPRNGPNWDHGILCTEVYGLLPTSIVPSFQIRLSIITPETLFQIINHKLNVMDK